MAKLVHPSFFLILDGHLRPELLYRIRRGRGRPATRGVITSSSTLSDVLENEEPTPGGVGGEGGEQHEEVSSVIVPSMVTVPPTDELVLTNQGELERWDAYNKQLCSVLLSSTKSAVNSFLFRFAGRSDSRNQPEGQAAWKKMAEKYLNSSLQWRRILMRKLNGMVTRPEQDPDE